MEEVGELFLRLARARDEFWPPKKKWGEKEVWAGWALPKRIAKTKNNPKRNCQKTNLVI